MSLSSDLQDLFNSMDNGSKTNADFCNGIASSIKSYVEGLTFSAPVVTGADSINMGTFTGSASGTLTITPTDISDTLILCCNEMWGNRDNENYDGANKLAEAFKSALETASSNITWDVSITGSTLVPGTPPVTISPVDDEGVVIAQFNSSTIASTLETVFQNMYDNPLSHDNAYFANQLALIVNTYFTTAVCSVHGTEDGGLIAAVGNGIMS